MGRSARAVLRFTVASAMVVLPLAAQSSPADSATDSAGFSPADQQRYMELGRRVTRWFFGGSADSIYAIASDEARRAMGGVDGIAEQMRQITEHTGEEALVLVEKMTRRDGRPQFWHEAYFTDFTDDSVVFRVIFDPAGRLIGLGISPAGQAPADGT